MNDMVIRGNMVWDPEWPFTPEEKRQIDMLAKAPLDYEIKALQEQGEGEEGFMHQSGKREFTSKMDKLEFTADINGNNEDIRRVISGFLREDFHGRR